MAIKRNDIETTLMDFHLHNQADEYPAPLTVEEQKNSYRKVREELPTPKCSVRDYRPEVNVLYFDSFYLYSRLMRDGLEHWIDTATDTMRRSYASYKAFMDSCRDLMCN
jgi:hypothetical protein